MLDDSNERFGIDWGADCCNDSDFMLTGNDENSLGRCSMPRGEFLGVGEPE